MLTAKGTKLTKGEKKKRLPDEEKASRTVTINLDGLSHEAIIGRVAEVMRDVGSPEREIACFKEDAINARNYETVIATAIGWKAPVRFIRMASHGFVPTGEGSPHGNGSSEGYLSGEETMCIRTGTLNSISMKKRESILATVRSWRTQDKRLPPTTRHQGT